MAKIIRVGVALSMIILLGLGVYFYFGYQRIDQRNYNPDVSINENKNYVIEIWDLKNPNFFILEEDQQRVWNEIAVSLQEKYSNVQLEVKLLSEEEYTKKITTGIKKKNMADIVIDWYGTPFIDTELQIPINKYMQLDDGTFLNGPLEYVKYNEDYIGYPLIAKPEMLIANLEIIEQFEDIIGIAVNGWTFEELEKLLSDIKSTNKKPMNVMDYKGVFTSSLLVQGDVNNVMNGSSLNWYGQTMIDMYVSLNTYLEQGFLSYNPRWLVDFWHGEVGIIGGIDTWLVAETLERNEKLKGSEIKGAGSTKEINTFLMPYPHKRDYTQRYAMSTVSAIPFSQGSYKGEDHSKLVVEIINHLAEIYSLEFSQAPGFIPAKESLTKTWSNKNGLDDFSNRSVQLSAIHGKPMYSRYFENIKAEQEGIQAIQVLLDEFWQGKKDVGTFFNELNTN
ncbi:hypothetical protein HYG86_02540 [Alkalicella caledoniensis]|uniref:Extracellular solute-binding protein n=1 Tax=Alkalicella caledoniensis TaxID=2731377 RepID=A0A7G9W4V1_ALKCA|nr:extracellular solute-binding protein [Alkalicella caledoniensis]QNO13713.1 hypothetical protein HYG86_02540 [Alkalicella caledoniensis]